MKENWLKKMKLSENHQKLEKWWNQKMGKLKWGRLGRYKNRNESRKKVLDSWDRALLMGHVEWSVRVQEKCKKGENVFDLRAEISTHCCWQTIFWCFCIRGGSESCNFVIQNWFLFKFRSKTFFSWFFILSFCCTYNSSNFNLLKSEEENKISPKC